MRPVDKSKYTKNKASYDLYGNAKPDLIKAIGNYCSYCERVAFSSALDVEHIEDKKHNPTKEYLWSNFLLACKNCNSIKGTDPINFSSIFLPHLDNTFTAFEYLESGFIKISTTCTGEHKTKATNLINLVGLDRIPGHGNYSPKDERWLERKKCWELATRYLSKYTNNKADIETIKDLALSIGFWSIWMNIFQDFTEVKKELILTFSGTRDVYFLQELNND